MAKDTHTHAHARAHTHTHTHTHTRTHTHTHTHSQNNNNSNNKQNKTKTDRCNITAYRQGLICYWNKSQTETRTTKTPRKLLVMNIADVPSTPTTTTSLSLSLSPKTPLGKIWLAFHLLISETNFPSRRCAQRRQKAVPCGGVAN